jgi:hypothetical protein
MRQFVNEQAFFTTSRPSLVGMGIESAERGSDRHITPGGDAFTIRLTNKTTCRLLGEVYVLGIMRRGFLAKGLTIQQYLLE